MRKVMALLLLTAMLLSLFGCGKESVVSPTLEFQGIPWNSSLEVVCQKLALKPEQYTQGEIESDATSSAFDVTLRDWKVFGETAASAVLLFENFNPEVSNHFGLTTVLICYPESSDKEKILSNLRKEYGPEAETYTLYNIDGTPREYTREPGEARWFSQQLAVDVLTDGGKEAYRNLLGDRSEKEIQGFFANPAAQISWTEDFYSGLTPDLAEELISKYGHMAYLSITGSGLTILSQRFDTVSE